MISKNLIEMSKEECEHPKATLICNECSQPINLTELSRNNQIRIPINHGSARVDPNISPETVQALNEMTDKALNAVTEEFGKETTFESGNAKQIDFSNVTHGFIKRVDDIISELDEEDVAGHLWWNKFKEFLLT